MPTEKIVCEVFRVGDLTIRHSVAFGIKWSDGSRRGAVSNYTYKSNKYTNANELTAYQVNTEDYLIFEKYGKTKEEKVQILMSYQHIPRVKKMFRKALKWVEDDEYLDLFIYKDDIPYVNTEMQVEEGAFNLVGGKAFLMRPNVVQLDNEYYEGYLLYFNNEETFIELTYDMCEAVSDFLDSFRLYEASRLLFNSQQLISPIKDVEYRRPSMSEGPIKSQGLKPNKKKMNSNDFEI